MLGILGLLGALFAGVLADSMINSDSTPAEDDADPADGGGDDAAGPSGASIGDMLTDGNGADPATGDLAADDPSAGTEDASGMPRSDDDPDPVDDDVSLIGDAADDILTGNGGDDLVIGGDGGDLLGGRGGDDTIDGGAGADVAHGGEGVDFLTGGAGVDDLQGEAGDDDLAGNDGGDTISGAMGADLLTGGAGADSLIGGDGGDRLESGADDDVAAGGLGDDLMAGGTGSDEQDGGDGNDTIWGQEAGGPDDHEVDFLNGGAGDDLLRVGAGDYANGGDGADLFLLEDIQPGDPLTQITEFHAAEDEIVVLYDPATHPDPEVTLSSAEGSADATLLLDGIAVAVIAGGAGLSPDQITLQAA